MKQTHLTIMRKLKYSTCVAIAATLTIALHAIAGAAPSYTVSPVPVPEGYVSSAALCINNAGDVAGDLSLANGNTKAFLYSSGVFHIIVPLAGYTSCFVGGNYSLNNRELVTAVSIDQHSNEQDFAYQRNKRTPVSAGGINIGSVCVDDSNLIAVPQGSDLSLFQYPGGTTTLVPVPKSTDGIEVSSINLRGNVVGIAVDPSTEYGFLYSNGAISFLPLPKGIKTVFPYAINASNVIAGDLMPSSGGFDEAATYSKGKWTLIPTPAGTTLSRVFSMNNSGDVVGYFESSSFSGPHGFIYTGDTFYDLNDLIDPSLGYTITSASSINAGGQIAAEYTQTGGSGMYAILSPS